MKNILTEDNNIEIENSAIRKRQKTYIRQR